MKVTMTEGEMLREWKQAQGWCPTLAEGVVSRVDGYCTDEVLAGVMRGWYLRLLDEGDLEMVCETEMRDEVTMAGRGDGRWEVWLPESVRRVVSVRLGDGEGELRLVSADSRAGRMSGNVFGPRVGVRMGRRCVLVPGTGGGNEPRVMSVMCVVEPSAGIYELDERGLKEIYSLDVLKRF